jgi:signal transduction histidine kinase
MLAQALERGGHAEVGEELRRRVASIQRQVSRLAALANSVLDLSRIRSARLRLELESCDLCEVARDVMARFDDAMKVDGRVLALFAPAPLVGRWDRTRVEQLLSNLVGNAVKHAGRGAITVSAVRSGGVAVVTVADTGPGIPEDEQARIFDAFAQWTRATSGGLGLGLYIARSIAAAHGGRIDLESAPGRGTIFKIGLPLETVQGIEAAAAPGDDAPDSGPAGPRSPDEPAPAGAAVP